MAKGQAEVPVDVVDVNNLLSRQTGGSWAKIVKLKRKIKQMACLNNIKLF